MARRLSDGGAVAVSQVAGVRWTLPLAVAPPQTDNDGPCTERGVNADEYS